MNNYLFNYTLFLVLHCIHSVCGSVQFCKSKDLFVAASQHLKMERCRYRDTEESRKSGSNICVMLGWLLVIYGVEIKGKPVPSKESVKNVTQKMKRFPAKSLLANVRALQLLIK